MCHNVTRSDAITKDGRDVQVGRIGSALTIKPDRYRIPPAVFGSRFVSSTLYITFGETLLIRCLFSESSKGSDNQTQISFPVLPAAKSPLRFALLREWLQWCDKSHRCNQHDDDKDVNIPKKTLPTRLLYVGNPDDPDYDQDILKLVLGQQIGARKYIALSHCWGKLTTDQKNNFWTTKGNVDDRGREFSIAKLPRTFQDAIKVARELRILYLWIDSLCILQDDKEDWRFESARMEDVFTSAYCTVAATSAVDTNAGFLEQNISSENVYVQDNSSRRAYVCTDMADFDNKVEKAQLNTQAWVMQERLLSCQTIHFGANQTSRLI